VDCYAQAQEVGGVSKDQAEILYRRGWLAGLDKRIGVVVSINQAGETAGLRKSQLQTAAELKLRQFGFVVPTPSGTPEMPLLEARILIVPSPGGLFLYRIEVELVDLVRLERNPAIKLPAGTWSRETGIGGVQQVGLNIKVREHLEELITGFINDYLAANPSSPVP
jgi:hypothetical protein